MGFLRSKEKNRLADEVFLHLYSEIVNGNFVHDHLTYKQKGGAIYERWELCDGTWTPFIRFQLYKSPRDYDLELKDHLFRFRHRRRLAKALRAHAGNTKTSKYTSVLKKLNPEVDLTDGPSEKELRKAIKNVESWVK